MHDTARPEPPAGRLHGKGLPGVGASLQGIGTVRGDTGLLWKIPDFPGR